MEQDNNSISWNFLPWRKFQKKSFGLQRKIYSAKHNEKYNEIKRFQKLLLASRSLYYIAVKRVTEYHTSKGIFVSKQVKVDMVNELHETLRRYKNLVYNFRKSMDFFYIEFLKTEALCYIWSFVLDPVYRNSFSVSSIKKQFKSTKYLKKISYVYHILSKIKKETILFTNTSLQRINLHCLKGLLNIPIKYNSLVSKLILAVNYYSYFRFEYSIFRTILSTLFLKRLLFYSKQLHRYKLLATLNVLEKMESIFLSYKI